MKYSARFEFKMKKATKMIRRTISFPPDVEKHVRLVMKHNKLRSPQLAVEACVRGHAVLWTFEPNKNPAK